jgi:hypothetical protein
MSDIDKAIMTPIEAVVGKLPLGNYPAGRALWGAGIGGAIVFGVKPSFMFNEDGTEKPWIVFDSSNPDATIFPWWAGIVTPALLLGVFV